MPRGTNASTLGQRLHDDPEIDAAIASIVGRVSEASERIAGVRGPIAALAQSYEAHLAVAGLTRGQGLVQPYLGSGIGHGALVELMDGSVKWDMICGIGVHFFGHSDPDLLGVALRAGLDDTVKHGNLQSNFEAYALSRTLLDEAAKGSDLAHCFLTTGGALANENALKICFQKHAPACRVIAFEGCFMGRTTAMSQIGDTPAYRQGIPLSMQVDYMPFFDPVEAERVGQAAYIKAAVSRLERCIGRYPGQHACFVFELVQGEGGFNTASREFFEALMRCSKDNGVAVWVDEIQTFGRTESMFAYDQYQLGQYVDVVTVGKMTHACATLFTGAYNPRAGLLSGTFTGEGVSFAVGRRIIERLRDGGHYGPHGINARHHRLFVEQVRDLASRHPDWFGPILPVTGSPGVTGIVGGLGGMMRFTPFGGQKDAIARACRACFDEGVILFSCGRGPYHLRMLPPLGVMREEDWPGVFECVERGLGRAAAAL